MQSVRQLIESLLPAGSRQDGSLQHCPLLPADAFAVAATLVDQSSCYTQIHKTPLWDREAWRERPKQLRLAGRRWARTSDPPPEAQHCWTTLVQATGPVGDDRASPPPDWWKAALDLLAMADEASSNVGFTDPASTPVANFYLDEQTEAFRQGRPMPVSLCRVVPTERVCVQPKTRTAQVGATLRSLTHHLALLPPDGIVQVRWHAGAFKRPTALFNLLVVPFPYTIPGSALKPIDFPGHQGRYFDCDQPWLPKDAKDLVDFLRGLVDTIQATEGATVHGIVLPELALSEAMAREAAQVLLRTGSPLEVFVSGIKAPALGTARGRNCAYGAMRVPRTKPWEWRQAKHHRWKLDRAQLQRYRLGHVLGAERAPWWEAIDISEREVNVTEFRRGTVMTVMVCEDLARVDPVQTVLRSIGPNLVVALLMDGPQLKDRWSALYATVLADDPGSSVLTLTSVGMLRRSGGPTESTRREIALWREPGSRAQELVLPKGSHALLLSLNMDHLDEEYTMDGRTDKADAITVRLLSYVDVRHPNPPPWVRES